jgi:hypothetical protein
VKNLLAVGVTFDRFSMYRIIPTGTTRPRRISGSGRVVCPLMAAAAKDGHVPPGPARRLRGTHREARLRGSQPSMAVAGRSSRSAEELAKHSDVSLTTIKEIEHATELRNRRKETLPKLSIALGAGLSKRVDC